MFEVLRGLRNPTRPGYIVVMSSKDTLSAFEKAMALKSPCDPLSRRPVSHSVLACALNLRISLPRFLASLPAKVRLCLIRSLIFGGSLNLWLFGR